MPHTILLGLTTVIVLGAIAQWLAWALRVPSILLLLLFGFAAGPIAGWLGSPYQLQPDQLFGDLLLPFVSIAVALILFEGGLTLRLREIHGVRAVVGMLVSVGVVATWLLAGAAAHWLVGLSLEMAALVGAIVSVTGPTVVLPLLRHIKPSGRVGPLLKWEGIVIDPIGALLAVLVFEVIAGSHSGAPGQAGAAEVAASVPSHVATALGKTLLAGGGLGLLGAGLLALCLRRYWVADHLQSAVALMLVVAMFAAANVIQGESGLLAVTVMGISLANQRFADVEQILAFKEDLRVFLLSAVFILLSARLRLEDVGSIGFGALMFVAALVLVVRPAAVALSTVGSRLNWRERAFLAWMAPRGIVAAAMTSVFALALEQQGHEQARLLVPLVFATIVGTVLIYGASGGLVARRLGLADADPQGVLFVGADPFARMLAAALQRLGLRVLLVDTNRAGVVAAQMQGLPTLHGSILSEDVDDKLDLSGIGRLLALTSNDEVNVLAAERFGRVFGRARVYQLPTKGSEKGRASVHHHRAGRRLFREDFTYAQIAQWMIRGAGVKATKLTETFDFEAFRAQHGAGFVPLFVVTDGNRLQVVAADDKLTPKAGQTLVSFGLPGIPGADDLALGSPQGQPVDQTAVSVPAADPPGDVS